MRGGLTLFGMLGVWTLVGCGGGGSGGGGVEDGGRGDQADAGVAIAPTAPPGPPVWTCPAGWRETREDPGGCEPFAEDLGETCAAHEAQLPGSDACVSLGEPCPAGDFAQDVPEGAVFALAGAATGGDGSRARPFSTIEAAVGAARAGGVVAVGRGTYDEAIRFEKNLTLLGACAAETRLTRTSGTTADRAALHVMSPVTVTVKNVTVEGGTRFGAQVQRGTLMLHGVALHRTRTVGIFVGDGGTLIGDGVSILATAAPTGRAVNLESGGTIRLSRCSVRASGESALYVSGGGTLLALEDCVVADGRGDPSGGANGAGLEVNGGAAAELTRVLVEKTRTEGVRITGTGSRLRGQDLVVRDVLSERSSRGSGYGISASEGASVELARVRVARARGSALLVTGAATMTATDVIVEDTQPYESDGSSGRALQVQGGASATITRAALVRNRDAAVSLYEEGSSLTLTDVRISDTAQDPTVPYHGHGLNVVGAVQLVAERVRIEGAHASGAAIACEGECATLTDFAIVGTRANEDGEAGRGLWMARGAHGQLLRGTFEDNREVAVVATHTGTRLEMRDVVVRRTSSLESDGTFGRALHAEGGAVLTLVHGLLEGNREAAICSDGPNARVELDDVAIRDTAARACAATTCTAEPGGVALIAAEGGVITARGSRIEGAALCGISVAMGGLVDFTDGRVARAPIGACIADGAYDVSRITRGVVYEDNGVNVSVTNVPIPSRVADLVP